VKVVVIDSFLSEVKAFLPTLPVCPATSISVEQGLDPLIPTKAAVSSAIIVLYSHSLRGLNIGTLPSAQVLRGFRSGQRKERSAHFINK